MVMFLFFEIECFLFFEIVFVKKRITHFLNNIFYKKEIYNILEIFSKIFSLNFPLNYWKNKGKIPH